MTVIIASILDVLSSARERSEAVRAARAARELCALHPSKRLFPDVWAALQEEWENIDLAYIQHLYDSLPARVQALNKAHGHQTRY